MDLPNTRRPLTAPLTCCGCIPHEPVSLVVYDCRSLTVCCTGVGHSSPCSGNHDDPSSLRVRTVDGLSSTGDGHSHCWLGPMKSNDFCELHQSSYHGNHCMSVHNHQSSWKIHFHNHHNSNHCHNCVSYAYESHRHLQHISSLPWRHHRPPS